MRVVLTRGARVARFSSAGVRHSGTLHNATEDAMAAQGLPTPPPMATATSAAQIPWAGPTGTRTLELRVRQAEEGETATAAEEGIEAAESPMSAGAANALLRDIRQLRGTFFSYKAIQLHGSMHKAVERVLGLIAEQIEYRVPVEAQADLGKIMRRAGWGYQDREVVQVVSVPEVRLALDELEAKLQQWVETASPTWGIVKDEEQYADMNMHAIQMNLEPSMALKDTSTASLGKTKAPGSPVEKAEIAEKDTTPLHLRKFLVRDGVVGSNVYEREANARRDQARRGMVAAVEYRNQRDGFAVTADPREVMTYERLESAVEERIRESMASGGFDNLEGKGKPLKRLEQDDNTFVPYEDRVAFDLLKKNGFAPDWVEKQKEVREGLQNAKEGLAIVYCNYCRDSKTFTALHNEKKRFKASLKMYNRMLRDHNLICPLWAQQPTLDIAAEQQDAIRMGGAMFHSTPAPTKTREMPKMVPLRDAIKISSLSADGGSVWGRIWDAFSRVGAERSASQ
mmetsp:Transcript_28729/g.61230  ORF Transcript_28729/g.61230 Transcript_28729/m.61230 type:complete len:512 (+) Transcript_28729:30-1565(+)